MPKQLQVVDDHPMVSNSRARLFSEPSLHIVEQMIDGGVDGFILKTSDTGDILKGVLYVLGTGALYL